LRAAGRARVGGNDVIEGVGGLATQTGLIARHPDGKTAIDSSDTAIYYIITYVNMKSVDVWMLDCAT
jgi:hypothetical protein